MSRDIFDYLKGHDKNHEQDPTLVTDLQYEKEKRQIKRDLSQVFESNKSLTCKISFLNRQNEKAVKRMKDLLQVKEVTE